MCKTLAPFLTTALLMQEVRGEIHVEDVLEHLSGYSDCIFHSGYCVIGLYHSIPAGRQITPLF